ncbi:MAG TPA: crosslink repair DNA glycosylase YcaQ family protein [Acidimicrobiia bacterium]
MRRTETLSLDEARRVTLAAQGFAVPRPRGRVDRRHLRALFARLGMVQLDSVNVLVRSHYLPLFSRLGPYDRTLLDRFAYEEHEVFEYWGHEASLISSELEPLLRWRMTREHRWAGMRRFIEGHDPAVMDALAARVLADGPLSAGDLDGKDRKAEPWWGWGDTKRSLEHLFSVGRVGAVRRSSTFERAYVDPAQVIPADVRARPTPDVRDALAGLLEQAARTYGIATAKDLSDFFRLPIKEARPVVEEMADAGALRPVGVEGWTAPAFLHPAASLPRSVDACALVSPFDSVMWERERVERLFGFSYRIEIYVPKPKRTFGYYVLPFLLGDRYAARVDLKADRAASRLLVQAAWGERGVDPAEVADRLGTELRTMAAWLGLEDVVVSRRGDLATALRRALA